MLGTGKDRVFAHVSCNKYGVGDILGTRASGALRWSGTIKSKLKGRGPTLEETWPDHAIRSSVAITKLPLGRAILKKKKKNNNNNNKKEKCDFWKIFFLWIF